MSTRAVPESVSNPPWITPNEIREALVNSTEEVRQSPLVKLFIGAFTQQQKANELEKQEKKRLSLSQKLSDAQANINLTIFFDSRSTTVNLNGYKNSIDKITTYLKKHPQVHVFIKGHADHRGFLQKNAAISKSRAEFVQTHLKDLGIAINRLKIDGVGSSSPQEGQLGTSLAEYARNRRVTIEVDIEATRNAFEEFYDKNVTKF